MNKSSKSKLSKFNTRINMAGKKCGRWTVVRFDRIFGNGDAGWLCRCDCGNSGIVNGGRLRYGQSQSCGCLRSELKSKRNTTHGMTHTSEYDSWNSMFDRCYNPEVNGFHRYGGRGIKVCKRWNRFENFFKDMGRKPSLRHQIDRINGDRDYKPSNCRWATRREQANNRSTNHVLFAFGKRATISEFSRMFGIGKHTIRLRILRGWDAETAITKKPRCLKRKK